MPPKNVQAEMDAWLERVTAETAERLSVHFGFPIHIDLTALLTPRRPWQYQVDWDKLVAPRLTRVVDRWDDASGYLDDAWLDLCDAGSSLRRAWQVLRGR